MLEQHEKKANPVTESAGQLRTHNTEPDFYVTGPGHDLLETADLCPGDLSLIISMNRLNTL